MTWRNLSAPVDGLMLSHEMRAGDYPILMVHGIGPGTTGRANFGPLLDRLSPRFALHLIDLAGFGNSDRKLHLPFFDVPFWLRQIGAAIDHIMALHKRPPLLVGNSVGGALALKTAARRSDLRQLLVIGAPARAQASAALRAFWQAPCCAASLAAAMRPMTAAEAEPSPELVAERYAVFARDDAYAAYFNTMLADPDACLADAVLTPAEAERISAQIVLIHGRQDRACPVDATLATLHPMLPEADLVLLDKCGHTVISECRADVLAAIERLEKADLP